MPKKKKVTSLTLIILLVLGFFAILVGSRYLQVQMFGWVSPGWEIYNRVAGLRHNSVDYTEPGHFTNPRDLMGTYLKGDIDEPEWGVPTMQVLVGDIHHVDFMGNDIPYSQYADTREVVIGNQTFYLDYHIYLYTVTIRTVGDTLAWNDGVHITRHRHETSWDWEAMHLGIGYNWDNQIGAKFLGGAWVKFIINPWTGVGERDAPDAPEGSYYQLDNAWCGVMNSYVADLEMGQVANQWGDELTPDPSAPYHIRAAIAKGNQVPMFEDDGSLGTPAPTVDWDPSLTPDVRIESTVVHYLPVDMGCGAHIYADAFTVVQEVVPCDVYVMYDVRIDVLQTHEFSLQTGDPPDPEPPTDFFSWAMSFWDTILGLWNPFRMFGEWGSFVAFLFLLLIIGLIVIILLAIFAPQALVSLGRIGKGEKKPPWADLLVYVGH